MKFQLSLTECTCRRCVLAAHLPPKVYYMAEISVVATNSYGQSHISKHMRKQDGDKKEEALTEEQIEASIATIGSCRKKQEREDTRNDRNGGPSVF